MATAIQLQGAIGETVSDGETTYWALVGGLNKNSTEANVATRMYSTVTLANLLVRVTSNTTTASSTIRSRKNTANGNLSVSIGAAATGEFEDTSSTDSLADGDDSNYQVVSGGGGLLRPSIVSCTIEEVSTMTSYLGLTLSLIIARGTTRFGHLNGRWVDEATETNAQYTIRMAATWSRLRGRVLSNATANGGDFRSRVNGANGNQVAAFGGGATGDFEDASNSDTLADGDEIGYQIDAFGGGSPANATIGRVQTRLVTTTDQFLTATGGLNTIDDSTTNFLILSGDNIDDLTESQSQGKMRGSAGGFDVADLFAHVKTNGLDGTTTIRNRKGGADGNLSISITSGQTGFFEDNASSDSYADGDEGNYSVVTGGTTGTILIDSIGLEFEETAAVGGAFGQRSGVWRIPDSPRYRNIENVDDIPE